METWDYIVVGAGSAGCVVASRLSEMRDVRVLLLEAGGPADSFWVRTPAGMAKLFQSSRHDWGFSTEPVPGLRDRRIYWPRGKGLGGSSAINGMVYTRGNRRDYDYWEKLGNPGWGWQDVLPHFMRSENNLRGPSGVRGVGGPLTVSDPAMRIQSVDDFVEAAVHAGVVRAEDLSCAGEEGVGVLQATIGSGVRQSAYDAFIKPALARPNLEIRTGMHVRRVIFNGRVAAGVEVHTPSGTLRLHAKREVVLCAGALASPQLLMLSGVGDAQALAQFGIPTVAHLPGVGRNLQDHCSVHVKFSTRPGSSYNLALRGWRKYLQGARYLLTKGGYLALPSSLAAAFVRSNEAMDYADLEISFRPMTFSFNDDGAADVDPFEAISASVYRVRPASRGELLLRSTDPLQPAAFHPNYLDAEEDRVAMLAGLRKIRQIFAISPIAASIRAELSPGPLAITDDQLLSFVEHNAKCAYHPAGTCKMGQDPMAVVDPQLRVHGIDRLRVIDASVMPTVTSGNTNAPTIMIGEKGADLLKAFAPHSPTT
jgi:choline dehydrogenase